MDNQSTSSRNESQDQETSSRNELEFKETGRPNISGNRPTKRQITHPKLQNILAKFLDYEYSNSFFLATSFLLQGMLFYFVVVNLREKNGFSVFFVFILLLNLILIVLQLYLSILVKCCPSCRIDPCGAICFPIFAILIQIAIIVLVGIDSNESVIFPSLSISISNFFVVSCWSWTFYKLSKEFEKSIKYRKGYPFMISDFGVLGFYLFIWKQALIGFLIVMLQLQNPLSSDYCNVLYNILIFIHLFLEDYQKIRVLILRPRYWYDYTYNYSIAIETLNLITCSVFIIFSYVGRSKLSSLQLTIWIIIIAIFLLQFILFIRIVIKAFRKRQNANRDGIDKNGKYSSDIPAQPSNTRFPTTSVSDSRR